MLSITGVASLFANPFSAMIQKISLIWEGVFLVAEASIQVLEPPKGAYLLTWASFLLYFVLMYVCFKLRVPRKFVVKCQGRK